MSPERVPPLPDDALALVDTADIVQRGLRQFASGEDLGAILRWACAESFLRGRDAQEATPVHTYPWDAEKPTPRRD